MYERVKGKSGVRNGGDGARGHEVVRPFKSRFFWPHRHSQNSSIYPIDVEQSHLHESTMLRMTIRATSSAINSSYLLTADYSYLYVFTSHIRFSSARKITGLRSRQEQNKPPTYLYCARGKIRRKKATDYEKG